MRNTKAYRLERHTPFRGAAALLCGAFLTIFPLGAGADPLERKYIASKKVYLEQLKDAIAKGDSEAEKPALKDLESQLRQIIGSPRLKGFPEHSEMRPDTLLPEDTQTMDGLFFWYRDNHASAMVTTEALVSNWVQTNNWGGSKTAAPPKDVVSALKNEALYHDAVNLGSASSFHAVLPIKARGNAKLAVAMLALESNGSDCCKPNVIVIGVIAPPRVYLVRENVTAKVSSIPACDKLWRESWEKRGDQEDSLITEERAGAIGRACSAKHAPSQPFFPEVVK